MVSGFAIDSRQIREGEFFVPLKGEREDGHRYVPQAFQRGAAGSFYALHPAPSLPARGLLIAVPDVLKALQQVASAYRRRFDLPVVGITGSSGKTTTKDYIAGVLSSRFNVLKTEGNLNNEIGLPLTLLGLDQQYQVAVLEMGMSARGEITALAEMADPGIGVITNIGEAHLEMLGTVEAIAAAKGELLDYIGAGGVAVLNGDDPRLVEMGKRFPGKAYYYGFGQGEIKAVKLSRRGEISFFRVRFPDGQEYEFSLPLPGRHLVSNALAAVAVGYLFKISPPEIQAGLQGSRLSAGRLQVLENAAGIRIIDDSYNANPGSVKASLQVLRELGGEKTVAVLGDMLELGPAAPEAHRAVGRFAARCHIGGLVAVGEQAREVAAGAGEEGLEAGACSGHEQALAYLKRLPLDAGWYILVKGSRGMRMEKIVQALLNQPEGEKDSAD